MLRTLFTVAVVLSVSVFAGAMHAPAQEAKPVVRSYTSPRPGSVNTYWIEAPRGVIVVDSQRSLSQSRLALARIREGGKPVVAVLVTHAHPDHFGGLGVLAEAFPKADIYASRTTADTIRTDKQGFARLTKQSLGDDFTARAVVPNKIIEDGATLRIEGIEIQTREFGAGEADSATVFYVPSLGAMFARDIVIQGATPFLLEANSTLWLRQLGSLAQAFPQTTVLYPAHGVAGAPAALIEEQTTYMTTFRSLVSEHLARGAWDGKAMNAAAKGAIMRRVQELYPNYVPAASIPNMLELNIDPVAKELSQAKAAN